MDRLSRKRPWIALATLMGVAFLLPAAYSQCPLQAADRVAVLAGGAIVGPAAPGTATVFGHACAPGGISPTVTVNTTPLAPAPSANCAAELADLAGAKADLFNPALFVGTNITAPAPATVTELGGQTFNVPGVYTINGNAQVTAGNLVLNGNGVYIFNITGSLTIAANVFAQTNTQPQNVYFNVGAAGAAAPAGIVTVGDVLVDGIYMAQNGITFGGRLDIGKLLTVNGNVTLGAGSVVADLISAPPGTFDSPTPNLRPVVTRSNVLINGAPAGPTAFDPTLENGLVVCAGDTISFQIDVTDTTVTGAPPAALRLSVLNTAPGATHNPNLGGVDTGGPVLNNPSDVLDTGSADPALADPTRSVFTWVTSAATTPGIRTLFYFGEEFLPLPPGIPAESLICLFPIQIRVVPRPVITAPAADGAIFTACVEDPADTTDDCVESAVITFPVTATGAPGQTVVLSATVNPAIPGLGTDVTSLLAPPTSGVGGVSTTFTFAPNATQVGTFTLTLRAADGAFPFCFATRLVTLVVSQDPTIDFLLDLRDTFGGREIPLDAADVAAGVDHHYLVCVGEFLNLDVIASDPDLTDTAVLSVLGLEQLLGGSHDPNFIGNEFVGVNLSDVLSFGNPTTSRLKFIPVLADVGVHELQYFVEDDAGCVHCETIRITVEESVPTTLLTECFTTDAKGLFEVDKEICCAALVLDQCDRPLPGVAVTFTLDGDTGNGGEVTFITGADGVAVACFTPLFPGTAFITISTEGLLVAGVPPPDGPINGPIDGLIAEEEIEVIARESTKGGQLVGSGAVDTSGWDVKNDHQKKLGGPVVSFFATEALVRTTGSVRGTLNIEIPGAGRRSRSRFTARSTRIDRLILSEDDFGRHAVMFGTLSTNTFGSVRFRADALDAATPGVPSDRFRVTVLIEDEEGFLVPVTLGGSLSFYRGPVVPKIRLKNDLIIRHGYAIPPGR
jgi:ice-binding like protein